MIVAITMLFVLNNGLGTIFLFILAMKKRNEISWLRDQKKNKK